MNKYVLDVGCNEGFLDIEIAMRCFPKQVYGIDIDYKLVKNARRTLYGLVKKDTNLQGLVMGENGVFEKNGEKDTQEMMKD